jgi:hypothetical protein
MMSKEHLNRLGKIFFKTETAVPQLTPNTGCIIRTQTPSLTGTGLVNHMFGFNNITFDVDIVTTGFPFTVRVNSNTLLDGGLFTFFWHFVKNSFRKEVILQNILLT